MGIKRYLTIYWRYVQFALSISMAYRFSYFIEVAVETAYAVWSIFYFKVIFMNVNEIGGWSYYEVIFLLGLMIVFFEVTVAVMYVWGLNELPEKIVHGDVDFALTKPVNSLFILSLSQPFLGGIISVATGVYMMGFALTHMGYAIPTVNIVWGILILLCGFALAYSFLVMLTSLSFVFHNAKFLPELGMDILEFGENPHTIYSSGLLKIVFYLLIPVIFIASVPARTVLHGVEAPYLLLAIGLTVVFWVVMQIMWKRMLMRYSSASS